MSVNLSLSLSVITTDLWYNRLIVHSFCLLALSGNFEFHIQETQQAGSRIVVRRCFVQICSLFPFLGWKAICAKLLPMPCSISLSLSLSFLSLSLSLSGVWRKNESKETGKFRIRTKQFWKQQESTGWSFLDQPVLYCCFALLCSVDSCQRNARKKKQEKIQKKETSGHETPKPNSDLDFCSGNEARGLLSSVGTTIISCG